MMRFLPCLVALALSSPVPAAAQTQVKGRVMVLLDTSGSMGFYFSEPLDFDVPPWGDYPGGDGSTSYTDNLVSNQPWFPGKLVSGSRQGVKSRLYAAKSALRDAVNAFGGEIDFGLMTFDFTLCSFSSPRCNTCWLDWGSYTCLYADPGFTKLVPINWEAQACTGGVGGGKVLVVPGAGSGAKIFPWIDGVEVHKDSGDGNTSYGTTGTPQNPEIRAMGHTPLADAINVARTQWYATARNGDSAIACRPYALVVATDGVQSTWDVCSSDPVGAAASLYAANSSNPVLTYVIGLSIDSGDQSRLNAIAAAGHTGTARFVDNPQEVSAAFADIVAGSVRYEECDGDDDNCNGLVDEGLGVYRDCTAGGQCPSGSCTAGRCACAKDSDCGAGYLCGSGLCRPSCAKGVGGCQRAGVVKCSSKSDTECCANDGQAGCTPLAAGSPAKETCNGQDDDCNGVVDDGDVCATCNPTAEVCDGKDNDCSGVADDNLTDVGKPCGLGLGVCQAGKTVCVADAGRPFPDASDHLDCSGEIAPTLEKCNGLDDDCDGIVDGMTQACYGGPQGTENVGPCHAGQQKCEGGAWDVCVGEIVPEGELCNGVDDDCNGQVDDLPGAGGACCPSGKCGVGQCKAGTEQCQGNTVVCAGAVDATLEVCDGADNDCNGKVDDIPGVGLACQPATGCGGTLGCDAAKGQVVCLATGQQSPEVCDGKDNNCNGQIDEAAALAKDDPRIGQPCGNGSSLPPPCKAGKTVCQQGKVVCQGAVGPVGEVCDGKDNNCNGQVDDGAPCPPDYFCHRGGCYAKCGTGEFPCPGGYNCTADGYCLPNACACKPCEKCVGNKCVDACADVSCGDGYRCDCGACVDDSCLVNGCDAGQRCDRASRACVDDPCASVSCAAREFCDPTGTCVRTCDGVKCTGGKVCSHGACVDDLCAGVQCAAGEMCEPLGGNCVADPCWDMDCGGELVCVDGACVDSPCSYTRCPDGAECHFSRLGGGVECGSATGVKPTRDQVVATGGGGLACSAGGRGSPTVTLGGALLLLLALAWRRGRRS